MMKFKAEIKGERVEFPARRFSHYVGGVRYWFALHEPINVYGGLCVSDWESGKVLLHISVTELACAVNTRDQEVARRCVDKLCTRATSQKVKSVLGAAHKAAEAKT